MIDLDALLAATVDSESYGKNPERRFTGACRKKSGDK
jgi:hypothetical protein